MKKRRILLTVVLVLLIICWWMHPFTLMNANNIDPTLKIAVTSTTFDFTEDDSPELTPKEYNIFPDNPVYSELVSLLTSTKCHFSIETIMRENQLLDHNVVYRFFTERGNAIRVFDSGVVYNGKIYYRIESHDTEKFFSELDAILSSVAK